MNLRERLRPQRVKLMLIIALIYSLSLDGVIAEQSADASGKDAVFTDIQSDSEYEVALTSLIEQKIIYGYADGTYRPSEKLNREQAAVILARALRLNLEVTDRPKFTDVNENSAVYKSIAAVVNAGIFQGYSDGTFKPNQSLTRAEMAKILAVAYQFPVEELVDNPFKDVPSTSWYAPYLTSLIQNKITTGTSLTTYSPNEAVNRGEMALFIYRCQQLEQQITERLIESEVTTITSDSVQLGNESFTLTDDLKTWMTPENLPILKKSRIKAYIIGGTISRIESVTLYADGPLDDKKKNSYAVLTGNGAVIDATIIIKGDNLSIKDATLAKNLIIENDVQNSFYVENVQVKGSTILSKPQEIVATKLSNSFTSMDIRNNYRSEVHFHNSILQSIEVALDGVTIRLTGKSKVNEIDLLVNAYLEADTSITIPIVRVGTEALNTALNAVIDSLFIENTNSRITLNNDAKIEDLRLKLKDDVNLIFLDYELNKHKIIRINGELNIDRQPSTGGSSNAGQNSNLIAAKNAVAGLFMDSTKTALKAGVDQAAIDAAKAKVDLVANGTEKSTLIADLQVAQQLLNAQLEESEAIANLQAATEAVNALFTDGTKTALKADVNQDAIDDAKDKIDLVPDGTEKSGLIVDLQIAQQLLNAQLEAIANLQTATEAVNALFSDSTKTALKAGVDQNAIDAAKAKVDLVPNSTEKSVLAADLQIAQQLLNDQLEASAKLQAATEAVNALFSDSTKTALKAGVNQRIIDAAKAKVNLVADGTEKSSLLVDLQVAQQLLNAQLEAIANLQAATETVNALFSDSTKTALKASVDQVTIDDAKTKVALVADGAEKSILAADLQIAQQLLNAQLEELEAIALLRAATEGVNGLFSDNTKTSLKTGIDQDAIDDAKTKVALVADGAEKSLLLADLQVAQQLLNAQLEAIANLNAATEAVNALFTDSTKTALNAGVNQGDIDAAKDKVNLVADGTEKSVLVADLQTAQQLLNDQIDATAKLQAATEAVNALFTDGTKTALKASVNQNAIDAAKAKVNLVADGTEKSVLVADLQNAQQLLNDQIDAIAKLQAATEAVNALFTDSTKTALNAGVNQGTIDAAKDKVNLVADGTEKSVLVADLQTAQQLLNDQIDATAKLQAATEAVNALFTDGTKTALKADVDQNTIDAAKAKVNLVADGTEKSALAADLQTAQQLLNDQIDATAKLQAATEAVNALFSDSTKTALKAGVNQGAIDAAKAKVDLVVDGAEKSGLVAHLQTAQQLLNDQIDAIAKLQAATEAVNALFTDGTKTALKAGVNQGAIDAAKDKVNLVADGAEKSALVADLQTAQQLLNDQIDAIAKLQAATEAVNALFTDSTKTALKASVDQNAIDAAKAKVNLVADGTEKSVLVADLQTAQQLLNDQIDAIAKLQAATEAVNALFTDSTKTALKAGVDQAAIDDAKAKVALVADSAKKLALEQAIEIAQDLLNYVLDAPTLMGTAPNVDTVRITFDDDAAWRNKITGVYLNDNSTPIHSSRVDRSNAGIIEISFREASLIPGTQQFLIKADGYADAIVTIEVPIPLVTPTLTGALSNTETVRITFVDDAVWRDKITGIYLNGSSMRILESRVNKSNPGIIEIDLTGVTLNPGQHKFLIKADGYEDVEVTIEVPIPLTAPTLTGSATNTGSMRITFTDDAAWRDKITGVYLNGNSLPIHESRVNKTTPGIIEFNFNDAPLSPGPHQFLIKAKGYADAIVTIEVPVPLTTPALTGTASSTERMQITFIDDAAWRNKITGVYLNGNSLPIHESRVNKTNPGIIDINLSGVSLRPGTHEFLIKADGYKDVMVVIFIES